MSNLSRFAKQRQIRFTLLSDPDSEIIRAFGVLNEDQAPGSFGYGIPHPTIVVLDAKGTVQARYSESGYTQRPDPGAVIEALSKLAAGKS